MSRNSLTHLKPLLAAGRAKWCSTVEHTSFIDARMLPLLVDLQQSVTSRGGTLTLRASHKVRRLLGVVGLRQIFHFTDGCPAAVG
jgi:anti-anti-sigma regulatory factor